jgi:hypothetical protein
MIGHQHVSVNIASVRAGGRAKVVEIVLVVLRPEEDRVPVDAASDYVLRYFGQEIAGLPGHGGSIRSNASRVDLRICGISCENRFDPFF